MRYQSEDGSRLSSSLMDVFPSLTQIADDSTTVDLAGAVTVSDSPRCDRRSEGSACPVFEGFWNDFVGEV
jgi:hypothetical protein